MSANRGKHTKLAKNSSSSSDSSSSSSSDDEKEKSKLAFAVWSPAQPAAQSADSSKGSAIQYNSSSIRSLIAQQREVATPITPEMARLFPLVSIAFADRNSPAFIRLKGPDYLINSSRAELNYRVANPGWRRIQMRKAMILAPISQKSNYYLAASRILKRRIQQHELDRPKLADHYEALKKIHPSS